MGIWGPAKLEIKILAEGKSDKSQNQTDFKTTVKVESKLENNESSDVVNQWIREADETRGSAPINTRLIRKPKFPPLTRLLRQFSVSGKLSSCGKSETAKQKDQKNKRSFMKGYVMLPNFKAHLRQTRATNLSSGRGLPEALVAECKNAETKCPLSHGQKFLKSSTTN